VLRIEEPDMLVRLDQTTRFFEVRTGIEPGGLQLDSSSETQLRRHILVFAGR
jgi:hypothetical protein